MHSRLIIFVILMLVLQSLSGLLLGRHLPHEHILVGGVTPEQLRAHLAEEALAQQQTFAAYQKLLHSPVIQSGGMILSVPLRGDVLSITLQVELALFVLFLGTIPMFAGVVAFARPSIRSGAFALFDPPPRFSFAAR